MSKPFFLTRQTANLMEDFARELKAGVSLFLLYGDSGVGKTRLLRELSHKRLSKATIHWIDLRARDPGNETPQDSSAEIEAIFKSAHSGDIIIADHFESALKKTRHQLFLSWSTDGVDKQVNLIIASITAGFNELRQLSQQYQVRVHSFQQMPFNTDEVEAFLGFYLFPDHPIGELSIPADLRKQLATTHGAVGQVIEIADRDGTQIGSSPMTDTESIRKGSRIIVAMLILLALTIGGGWYYLSSRYEPAETALAVASEPEPVVISKAVVEAGIQTEPAAAEAGETAAGFEPAAAPLTDPELEAEAEHVAKAEIETQPEPETKPAVDSNMEDPVVSEPGTASDTEAVIVEDVNQQGSSAAGLASEEGSNNAQVQVEQSDTDRFQLDLQSSMDWIKTKNNSIGTLQILLLSFATFDPVVYYEYVDYLASQQVDVTEIRVFKTFTGGTEVYSVVYSEYDSRRVAVNALDDLPAALKKISPIPRSVGGILEEIRRLGAVN